MTPPQGRHLPIVAATPFPRAAAGALRDAQLRATLGRATRTIRDKRAAVVAEVPDWERLRERAARVKDDVIDRLPELVDRFARAATAAGATVHHATDAAAANAVVTELVRAQGVDRVVKVKSMATQEIGLNEALAAAGVTAVETDLAELIVQLADDTPSHILVPAIHYHRGQIRELFARRMPGFTADSDDPAVLAGAAREYLRRTFLSARVAICGANFAVAETGSLVVVESEGNGRMCLTLPDTLIAVVGVEKLLPRFTDLGDFLRLLPRSSTGERMNPYTSIVTGVTPGDGPRRLHVVLLDNGRRRIAADPVGRAALRCIRCSACLNVCPVYERVGGHAYGSVYPGPIGAILSPQLTGQDAGHNATLPYASTLCGACYDVCPVKIDIPAILVHLRQTGPKPAAERAVMAWLAWTMRDRRRWRAALRTARAGGRPLRVLSRRHGGRLRRAPWPLSAWTTHRDAPLPAPESFRDWWSRTHDS
ncbi:lactate utilization protein [Micromonospora sp. HM134]|uniref:lactate utilization protein B n=1 Tax=unclassified Micromonospora TaxID=2617518 RepID=UPI0011989F6B|nr:MULTISPECIES: lactate utilization protein B [unclassified Micromonospora]QDY08242.1 lactate utilization protein [Micromonospora sp. HM134]